MAPPHRFTMVMLTLLVWLSIIGFSWGFVQEIIFHESETMDGNFFTFRSHIPVTTPYNLEPNNIKWLCIRGLWIPYGYPNYSTFRDSVYGLSDSNLHCFRPAPIPTYIQAYRHVGASDTDEEALSLYDGKNTGFYSGKELFISQPAFGSISETYNSYSLTGASNWTLFEGQNFDGPSHCADATIKYDFILQYNMSTIGSVYKSCNLKEIEAYRTSLKPAAWG